MRKSREQMKKNVLGRIPGLVRQLVEVALENYPQLLEDMDLIVATHSCKPERAPELADHFMSLIAAEMVHDNLSKKAQLRAAAFMSKMIDAGSDKTLDITTAATVRACESGYEIEMSDGWTFWVDNAPDGYEPRVGSVLWQHRVGACHILSVVIDGHVFRYTSLAQDRAEREAQIERNRALEREKFPQRDVQIAQLPEVFQQRIKRFQRAPYFREDLEGYELFVCEQAVAIAERLKTVQKLQIWDRLSAGRQRAFMPELSDGHTGNSFGMAKVLALAYLTEPENVPKIYGALAPMVGSNAYLPLEERKAS